MTPNQVADAIWIVGGWIPDLGIRMHQDGSYEVTNKDAHLKAIRFLDVALAVCQAESGFNPLAKNPDSNARGLWQIMTTVHAALIEQESKRWQTELGTARKPNIFHPLVNTSVAHILYQQSGWKPWEAYKTGAYKRYLGHGAAAMKYLLSPTHINADMQSLEANLISNQAYTEAVGIVVPGVGIASALPDWASGLFDFLKEGAMSVGVFVLGAILLILGVVYLVSQSKAGKAVIANTPAGLAAKVAG